MLAVLLSTAFLLASACLPVQSAITRGHGLVVGTEYIAEPMTGTEANISASGVHAVKPLPDNFLWGKMMSGPGATPDFEVLDGYIRRWQSVGVLRIMIALKSAHVICFQGANCDNHRWNWGVRKPKVDNRPKPQYESDYASWIQQVVERYDGDGINDMTGLKHPVLHYEIGDEFSSFEPENGTEYVHMLRIAYAAVKAANNTHSVVLHAAFLPLNVWDTIDPTTKQQRRTEPLSANVAELEWAWDQHRNVFKQDKFHDYADHVAVLDAHDAWDAHNIHALGHPREIDDDVIWLHREMARRGQTRRSVYITDTAPTSFIVGKNRPCPTSIFDQFLFGKPIWPVRWEDRCAVGTYYTNLEVPNELPGYVDWARKYVARDHVKRVMVSAGRPHVAWINTAFTMDMHKDNFNGISPCLGYCGNMAYSGLVDTSCTCPGIFNSCPCGLYATTAVYSPFYSLRRLLKHVLPGILHGSRVVERVDTEFVSLGTRAGVLDPSLTYAYLVRGGGAEPVLVVWTEQFPLQLPTGPNATPPPVEVATVDIQVPFVPSQGANSVLLPVLPVAVDQPVNSASKATLSLVGGRGVLRVKCPVDDICYVPLNTTYAAAPPTNSTQGCPRRTGANNAGLPSKKVAVMRFFPNSLCDPQRGVVPISIVEGEPDPSGLVTYYGGSSVSFSVFQQQSSYPLNGSCFALSTSGRVVSFSGVVTPVTLPFKFLPITEGNSISCQGRSNYGSHLISQLPFNQGSCLAAGSGYYLGVRGGGDRKSDVWRHAWYSDAKCTTVLGFNFGGPPVARPAYVGECSGDYSLGSCDEDSEGPKPMDAVKESFLQKVGGLGASCPGAACQSAPGQCATVEGNYFLVGECYAFKLGPKAATGAVARRFSYNVATKSVVVSYFSDYRCTQSHSSDSFSEATCAATTFFPSGVTYEYFTSMCLGTQSSRYNQQFVRVRGWAGDPTCSASPAPLDVLLPATNECSYDVKTNDFSKTVCSGSDVQFTRFSDSQCTTLTANNTVTPTSCFDIGDLSQLNISADCTTNQTFCESPSPSYLKAGFPQKVTGPTCKACDSNTLDRCNEFVCTDDYTSPRCKACGPNSGRSPRGQNVGVCLFYFSTSDCTGGSMPLMVLRNVSGSQQTLSFNGVHVSAFGSVVPSNGSCLAVGVGGRQFSFSCRVHHLSQALKYMVFEGHDNANCSCRANFGGAAVCSDRSPTGRLCVEAGPEAAPSSVGVACNSNYWEVSRFSDARCTVPAQQGTLPLQIEKCFNPYPPRPGETNDDPLYIKTSAVTTAIEADTSMRCSECKQLPYCQSVQCGASSDEPTCNVCSPGAVFNDTMSVASLIVYFSDSCTAAQQDQEVIQVSANNLNQHSFLRLLQLHPVEPPSLIAQNIGPLNTSGSCAALTTGISYRAVLSEATLPAVTKPLEVYADRQDCTGDAALSGEWVCGTCVWFAALSRSVGVSCSSTGAVLRFYVGASCRGFPTRALSLTHNTCKVRSSRSLKLLSGRTRLGSQCAPIPVQGCTGNRLSLCTNTQYCQAPSAGCDVIGSCQARPSVCTAVFDPVCGCDGVTYSSACQAFHNGRSVGFNRSCQAFTSLFLIRKATANCRNPGSFVNSDSEISANECPTISLAWTRRPMGSVSTYEIQIWQRAPCFLCSSGQGASVESLYLPWTPVGGDGLSEIEFDLPSPLVPGATYEVRVRATSVVSGLSVVARRRFSIPIYPRQVLAAARNITVNFTLAGEDTIAARSLVIDIPAGLVPVGGALETAVLGNESFVSASSLPLRDPRQSVPFSGRYLDVSFLLTLRNSSGGALSRLTEPLGVRVDVPSASDASRLRLALWDVVKQAWIDAATTCRVQGVDLKGKPALQLINDQLVVHICHLTQFALFEANDLPDDEDGGDLFRLVVIAAALLAVIGLVCCCCRKCKASHSKAQLEGGHPQSIALQPQSHYHPSAPPGSSSRSTISYVTH